MHVYGAHIFHTNNTKVWKYITQFAEFNRFTNSPVANYKGELYSLPFNMYTFNKMWELLHRLKLKSSAEHFSIKVCSPICQYPQIYPFLFPPPPPPEIV